MTSANLLSNTSRHIVAALAWLFGFPFLAVTLFASGSLPASAFHSATVSAIWGTGLAGIFGSWALRDAPAHGRSRKLALGFTAAWFLVFFLAVFPYLFVTRGAKGGGLAAMKFACLCLGVAIVWLAVPALFSRIFR